MTKVVPVLILAFLMANCQSKHSSSKKIVTTDITHFWEAYDQIITTKDTVMQYQYLDSLYLQKGSPGLDAIRQARNYTPKDYIDAINQYPKFWTSIRKNTLKAGSYEAAFEKGIEKLAELYPEIKPATIYFTMGVFRTGGTTLDSLVLIGSEMAMTDKNTVTTEFPERQGNALRTFFDSEPINDIVLLNVHEYVHTQQKPIVHNILSKVIYEGVAEFVSTLALNTPSSTPAVAYGKRNPEKVRAIFEQEMFYPNNERKWLYSNAPNAFGIRDMGYYVGYQMAENFYNAAPNKKEAIKQLIELDYTNEKVIETYVKATNYFSKSLETLYTDFEKKRPTIVAIKQFENGSTNVNPKLTEITFEFSEPLNGYNTGIDYGDLGKEAFPTIHIKDRVWSEDRTQWRIKVSLVPNKRYQFLVSNNFRTENDIPLRPLLIDFTTAAQ